MTQNNWEKYKEHMREKLNNQEERIREPGKVNTAKTTNITKMHE